MRQGQFLQQIQGHTKKNLKMILLYRKSKPLTRKISTIIGWSTRKFLDLTALKSQKKQSVIEIVFRCVCAHFLLKILSEVSMTLVLPQRIRPFGCIPRPLQD